MRILILLAVALFALSGLGYFAILNSDTIFLYLSPSLSLNIPLWAVMLVFSVLGFLASELRSLVLHTASSSAFECLWKKLGNSAELKPIVIFTVLFCPVT